MKEMPLKKFWNGIIVIFCLFNQHVAGHKAPCYIPLFYVQNGKLGHKVGYSLLFSLLHAILTTAETPVNQGLSGFSNRVFVTFHT